MKDKFVPWLIVAIAFLVTTLMGFLILKVVASIITTPIVKDVQQECKPPQHLGDKTEMYLYERDVDGVKVLSLMCIYNERKRK